MLCHGAREGGGGGGHGRKQCPSLVRAWIILLPGSCPDPGTVLEPKCLLVRHRWNPMGTEDLV